MSSDVWFRRDIQNSLTACAVAGQETASMVHNVEYLRGHTAAVKMLCAMFGIAPGEVLPAGQDAALLAYLEGAGAVEERRVT